jgi:hypothetical protein
MLFIQARERLASDGRMYVLFSSDSDLDLLGGLISRAGFVARLVAERSIFIESLIIYELRLQGETYISRRLTSPRQPAAPVSQEDHDVAGGSLWKRLTAQRASQISRFVLE